MKSYALKNALKSGHWPSLLGAWLHFEVSFVVWLLIGALGIAIAEDFALTATQKGVLVATPLLGGALLRIVVGPFTDQFGAKRVGLGILGIEVAALVLGWLSGQSYAQMFGVGFLLGAAGASFAVALPVASRAYPSEHQGLAMGIAATGNSGVLLATFFAPRLAIHIGWHGVFGLMIVPVLLAAIVFALFVQELPLQNQQRKGLAGSFRTVYQERFMQWLCFFYGVTFGGFVGFSSFLPIFFHDQYGLDMVAAGSLTAFCGLAGSIARPVGGHWADRAGGLNLLQVGLPAIGGVCILLAWLPPPLWAFPLTVMTLLLLGFGNGVVFQVASLRYRNMMGTASGFIGAAGGLGGFFLPFWFGLLKDVTGTYASGFLVFVVLTVIATGSVIWIQRSLAFSVKEGAS
ncbi:MAG: NarK/NasA family nitrate transporter [Nitrospira sp. SB0677_bin_15]|nr:NarK/NasA family nitrate transporter [Nitrospira sp. SB0667_bin_9]MYD30504.1 NarK/NasA family nitrate transporter [Nitrospira sp. SB0661_bin_20]MYG40093.1 NarK/NasA family nitrate transporter [Nitrospira sp. SB0677_bin_15]MYH02880.1 NarK/NasA family nitrate transporter [Nitrospira sp. SB0675_bin_23]MYJ22242.1 NarK/NasA family nitrate transporter [Nitrospira sp. SB0673_bin_12]